MSGLARTSDTFAAEGAGEHSADAVAGLLQNGRFQSAADSNALARLGRLDIVRFLGSGGMGFVFLAGDPSHSAPVAVKLLRSEWLNDNHLRKQFQAEAHHMQRLDHSHIVKVLEVCDRPDNPYFVMPYLEKGSLSSWIKPGQPLNQDLALRVTWQVAKALEFAHTRWIAHRDLKPDNVLLDAYSQVRVTDFGLSASFNCSSRVLLRRAYEGTAPFMSPALAAGDTEDTLADVYALGAMLYEMLTGHHPYHGHATKEILRQIVAGPPQPVLQLNPKAPPGLLAVCEACMARERENRYASMAAVVGDLERLKKGQEPLGPKGGAKAKKRWPWLR
jgi:serine/threonine-protein kinase